MSTATQPSLFYVAPSRIHGLGLFAKQPIHRNQRIGEYRGKILKRKQVIDNPHLDCTYMMSIKNKRQFIDGSDLSKNPMGYINHSSDRPNVRARELNNGRVWFYATKDIPQHAELLFDYQYDPAEKPCSLEKDAK